jgi:hypothetical protein
MVEQVGAPPNGLRHSEVHAPAGNAGAQGVADGVIGGGRWIGTPQDIPPSDCSEACLSALRETTVGMRPITVAALRACAAAAAPTAPQVAPPAVRCGRRKLAGGGPAEQGFTLELRHVIGEAGIAPRLDVLGPCNRGQCYQRQGRPCVGLPVHSHSLIADPATLARNMVTTALTPNLR